MLFLLLLFLLCKKPPSLGHIHVIELAILVDPQPLTKSFEEIRSSEYLHAFGLGYFRDHINQEVIQMAYSSPYNIILRVKSKDHDQEHEEPRQKLGSEGENLHDVHLDIGVPPSPDVKHGSRETGAQELQP